MIVLKVYYTCMLSKLLQDTELGLIGVQQGLRVADTQQELVEDSLDKAGCWLLQLLPGHFPVEPFVLRDAVQQLLTSKLKLVLHLVGF